MTSFSRRTLLSGVATAAMLPNAALARAVSDWPRVRSTIGTDPAVEARIDALIARMSVEEKVGQMVMPEVKNISPDDVRRYHIGGLLNAGGSWPTGKVDGAPSSWIAMAQLFYEASVAKPKRRAAIPVIWGTDAVHGHNNVQGATIFPHNIGLGAANDPGLMRDIGTATAREVAATGIDWTFAPSVAVARDPRWGRTYESYSSDPARVARLTKDFVLGLQGHPQLDNFLDDTKVIGTAKHFIADGGTDNGTDQGDFTGTEAELIATHLPGYLQAIGAGIQTVMASFSSWKGEKLHGHKYLLTDVLKGQMGFDGFIVGDWNGHEQLDGCSLTSCEQTINAGVDMVMVPNDWRGFVDNTLRQVKSGAISAARLDDAVRRILRVKIRAGVMDGRGPTDRLLTGRDALLGLPAHRAVARTAVQKSVVALKGRAPLIKPGAKIAVIGTGADHPAYQNGGWTLTWQGRSQETNAINPKRFYKGHTTIASGLRTVAGDTGYSIVTEEDADTVVIVFAEEPYAEMKGDLDALAFDLSDTPEYTALTRAKQAGKRVISVLMFGRPRGVDAIIDASDACVCAWLPGSEGAGVADVLLGRAALSGTLPMDWPHNDGRSRFARGYSA